MGKTKQVSPYTLSQPINTGTTGQILIESTRNYLSKDAMKAWFGIDTATGLSSYCLHNEV